MAMPSMPNLPGANAVTDTLEFMKSLWGSAKIPGVNLPGMVMPTLSVEEINKQIADLKAVESWLTVNMNLLHGTIKALEVQSATISTLQSMSANFSAAMQPLTGKTAAPDEAPPAFESPFARAAARPPEPKASAPQPAPAAPEPSASAPTSAGPAPALNVTPSANPAAWWNMLQEQFKQAVATATVPVTAAVDAAKRGAPAKSAMARAGQASGAAAAAEKTRAAPKAKKATKAKSASAPRKVAAKR